METEPARLTVSDRSFANIRESYEEERLLLTSLTFTTKNRAVVGPALKTTPS